MRIWERIKRLKQRLRKRGVTMLELVMALGLLFVAAGGVMTILAAGAGYPRHTQWVVVRDALAKLKLDSLTARATQPANAAYARRAPGGGRLAMQVLFLHGAYDQTCETVTSRLAEPMRAAPPAVRTP